MKKNDAICIYIKTKATQPNGRSILICVNWLALKKRSLAVKTCTVAFALS